MTEMRTDQNKKAELQAENIRLNEEETAVVILDQTKLPGIREFLSLDTKEECFDAIKTLKVRGAPAIGIFAGYAMYVLAKQWEKLSVEEFIKKLTELGAYLNSARPTAVNLSWAVKRMLRAAEGGPEKSDNSESAENRQRNAESVLTGQQTKEANSAAEIIARLGEEAKMIQAEDIAMCRKIAEYGLSVLKDGDGILTHCNAGPLATSCYGTALGPILLGHEQGMNLKVYADETRPLLQGARLTAYELEQAGVDVTLICDNMASIVMKNGWVDKVFVGCDRVAANGDAANKIGTSGVAILAKYYGIPFYVLGPSSTIDLDTPSGNEITIELRDPDEIKTMWYENPMAPEAVNCYNPSFDVTDHSLISGIITEKGIVYPPFEENLKELFS